MKLEDGVGGYATELPNCAIPSLSPGLNFGAIKHGFLDNAGFKSSKALSMLYILKKIVNIVLLIFKFTAFRVHFGFVTNA